MSANLPLECWEHIISFLKPDHHEQQRRSHSPTPCALRSLCVVSRAMHGVAVRYLYFSVILRANGQMQLLDRTLSTSPFHLSLILALSVDIYSTVDHKEHIALRHIFKLLYPSLRRLVFDTHGSEYRVNLFPPMICLPWDQDREPFERLEDLYITYKNLKERIYPMEQWTRWPTLRRLVLARANWWRNFGSSIWSLPKLSHIAFHSDSDLDVQACLTQHMNPSLRRIVIQGNFPMEHEIVISSSGRLEWLGIREEAQKAATRIVGLQVMHIKMSNNREEQSGLRSWFEDGTLWERGVCLNAVEDNHDDAAQI